MQTAEELELKLCPWCGAEAEFVQKGETYLWMIETGCECDTLSAFPRKCEVAAWWNERVCERDAYRQALVDAAKAECRYCANELPRDDSKDHIKWYGGGLPVYGMCSAKGIHDLIAKLNVEVNDNEKEAETFVPTAAEREHRRRSDEAAELLG